MVHQIMERKLTLFGHICRMKDNRLVKEVMFGTMDGETRRGRPCREWLDDIKEGRREQIHIGLLSWKAQDQGTCRMVVRMALDLYTGGEPMEQWMDEMHELVMQLNTLGTIASYLCVGYCGCSRITFGDVEFAITEWPN